MTKPTSAHRWRKACILAARASARRRIDIIQQSNGSPTGERAEEVELLAWMAGVLTRLEGSQEVVKIIDGQSSLFHDL